MILKAFNLLSGKLEGIALKHHKNDKRLLQSRFSKPGPTTPAGFGTNYYYGMITPDVLEDLCTIATTSAPRSLESSTQKR